MFAKVIAFFALVAVAFAIPNPKPEPQYVAYSAPAVVPATYSAYSAYSPYAYSAPLAAASAYPYAYSGYYVR